MAKNIINKISFGKKIRSIREDKNITQTKLAESIGISQNFLGDIERGLKLPSVETLIKISNFLKVSIDSLFAESLDNIAKEPEEIYYSDRQLAIMSDVIKTINENFKK